MGIDGGPEAIAILIAVGARLLVDPGIEARMIHLVAPGKHSSVRAPCRFFPFLFGGKPISLPAGIGVGIPPVHRNDRMVGIDRSSPEFPPPDGGIVDLVPLGGAMRFFGLGLVRVRDLGGEGGVRGKGVEKLCILPDGDFVFVDPESGQGFGNAILIEKRPVRNADHVPERLGFRSVSVEDEPDQGTQDNEHPDRDPGNDGTPVAPLLHYVSGFWFQSLVFETTDGIRETLSGPNAIHPRRVRHPVYQGRKPAVGSGPGFQEGTNGGREQFHLLTVIIAGGSSGLHRIGDPRLAVTDEKNAVTGDQSMLDLSAAEIDEDIGEGLQQAPQRALADRFACGGHLTQGSSLDQFQSVVGDSAILVGLVNEGDVRVGDQGSRSCLVGEGTDPVRITSVFPVESFQRHPTADGNLLRLVESEIVITLNDGHQLVVPQFRAEGKHGVGKRGSARIRSGFAVGSFDRHGFVQGKLLHRVFFGGRRFFGFRIPRCRVNFHPGILGQPTPHDLVVDRLEEEHVAGIDALVVSAHVALAADCDRDFPELLHQAILQVEDLLAFLRWDSRHEGFEMIEFLRDLPGSLDGRRLVNGARFRGHGREDFE